MAQPNASIFYHETFRYRAETLYSACQACYALKLSPTAVPFCVRVSRESMFSILKFYAKRSGRQELRAWQTSHQIDGAQHGEDARAPEAEEAEAQALIRENARLQVSFVLFLLG